MLDSNQIPALAFQRYYFTIISQVPLRVLKDQSLPESVVIVRTPHQSSDGGKKGGWGQILFPG